MILNKIAVLLSTYNGEKYLTEQIESILSQTYSNLDLFIRDDGSTDNTLQIIKDYSIKYKNIRIMNDHNGNLGPKDSFLFMLKNLKQKYEYYSFADQDDIWMDFKIQNAIKSIKKSPNETPSLYMSTYDVVDKNLNFIFKRNLRSEIPFTLENVIINRSPSACTMIFNFYLADYIINSHPKHFRMHDFWTLLTAISVDADIYVDDSSTMLYRQHESNSVGFMNDNYLTRITRLISSAVNNKNERQKQAKSVYDNYEFFLDENSKTQILKIINYRESCKDKFKLLLDSNFKSDHIYQTILFKISVFLEIF